MENRDEKAAAEQSRSVGRIVYDPVTEVAEPTISLRWNGPVLQQMWLLTKSDPAPGVHAHIRTEWRDVPQATGA